MWGVAVRKFSLGKTVGLYFIIALRLTAAVGEAGLSWYTYVEDSS